MTKRQYYTDAYTTQFTAQITEHLNQANNPAVILDQTYFYPTSGGQPADRGKINDISVLDVTIRAKDGAIVHELETQPTENEVTAVIDWHRRFDHMQQHTGQHILSQAFIRTASAQTIGFHLSKDSITIDLDKNQLESKQIEAAEQLTNEIIWQNLPIDVRFVTLQEVQNLSVRKIPDTQNEKLRLIDIGDFDLTACGGTHVAHTGEVGLLKVVKVERRGEKLRVEFCCGSRALADYRIKHHVISQLTTRLTTGYGELETAVAKLQNDNKQARRQLKQQQKTLTQFEAAQLLQNGRQISTFTLINQVFNDRDPGSLRVIGNLLSQESGVIAILGLAGKRSQLTFCRATDAPGDMNQLLKLALKALGSQSGGGSPTFAQGVGPAASKEQVAAAVTAAENVLLEEIANLS